jgi:hypothetical protein
MTIASDIKYELGPAALRALGARDFVFTANSLTFNVRRNPAKVSHVRIALDLASGLYSVKFLRDGVVERSFLGVHAASLLDLIDERTGLLSLSDFCEAADEKC